MNRFDERGWQDFHTHSKWSDSSETLHEIAAAAEEVGATVQGVADHVRPVDPKRTGGMSIDAYTTHFGPGSLGRVNDNIRDRQASILEHNIDNNADENLTNPEIIEAAIAYKENYGQEELDKVMGNYDEQNVVLLNNIEVDYEEKNEEHVSNFLDTYEFDIPILSVHYFKDVFDDSKLKYIKKADLSDKDNGQIEDILDIYFQDVYSALESDLGDILAHPNLVETNSDINEFLEETGYDIRSRYEEAASIAEKEDMNLEINLKARQGIESTLYEDIVLGTEVPYTIGTDAHRANDMFERQKEADQVLEKACQPPQDHKDILGMSPKEIVEQQKEYTSGSQPTQMTERVF